MKANSLSKKDKKKSIAMMKHLNNLLRKNKK